MRSVLRAFDAVSEHGSYQNIYKVLDPYGKITLVLSNRTDTKVPENITQSGTMVGAEAWSGGIRACVPQVFLTRVAAGHFYWTSP